jgi:hypothetical protein
LSDEPSATVTLRDADVRVSASRLVGPAAVEASVLLPKDAPPEIVAALKVECRSVAAQLAARVERLYEP